MKATKKTKKKETFLHRFMQGPDWLVPQSGSQLKQKHNFNLSLLGKWFFAYLKRIVSNCGGVLLFVLVITIVVSIVAEKNHIKVIAALIFALFIADFVFGLLFRPQLQVSRTFPPRVRQGTVIKVSYSVENRSKLSCFDILVDHYRPSKNIVKKELITKISRLAGKERFSFIRAYEVQQRGKYFFPALVCTSVFPLNLINWSSCSSRMQPILVYPNFTELDELILPTGTKFQRSGNSLTHNVGESNDFAGCREYRYGDDVRKIDWKSTARSGELTMKEYHQDYLTRTAVILDTGVKDHQWLREFLMLPTDNSSQKLEAAVSLAAAIADYICREDNIVDIFAVGSNVHHLKAGRGHACLDAILDILACVEQTSSSSISNISESVIREISSIGSAIIISTNWDDRREELYNKMLYGGAVVKKIIIGSEFTHDSDNEVTLNYKAIISGAVTRV